jgi:hypothetical protein
MPILQIPIPTGDPWVNKDLTLSDIAIKYLTAEGDVSVAAARKLGNGVDITTQTASIGSTPIYLSAIPEGTYRISYYAQVTVPASSSSSLQVTLGWTSNGVAQSFVGTAMTTNSTTTIQDATKFIHVDANTPITYATTYASVGATSMQYLLSVVLEQVSA